MDGRSRWWGLGLASASMVAIASVPPPDLDVHTVRTAAVRLASSDADTALGGGTALIVGPSFISTPSQAYADLVVSQYLAPHGFTGTTQILTTPEGLYPFTGMFSESFDQSVAQGQQIIDQAILNQITAGHVDAANPVVVFGWSQSSVIAAQLMHQLASQNVPSDDVHFVLVGDESAPNGGLLERFDLPADIHQVIPSLGLTFSGAQASDLYPTDVYTNEYDGFADFPQYPINLLADINALMGIAFNHTSYLGLTADKIAEAVQLPTSAADTLTNYYMIPEDLPLLDPLRLIPWIGNPLADLLQPDLSVLVNLGYGNVADNFEGGWSQGFADVPTPLGFLPSWSVLEQVPEALANGLQQGITDALKDLADPDNYVYKLPDWAQELLNSAAIIPGTTFTSPVPITTDDLFGAFPPHTGIPFIDVATALLITLPQYDYSIFTSELANNDWLDAIGLPIAADLGIVPLALIGGLVNIPL